MFTRAEKIKETCLLLILNILLPSVDVFSDVALIGNLYLTGSPHYASLLLMPFLLNYCLTWLTMWRLDRCRGLSWLFAALSCYPQYMATSVIRLMWKEPKKALEKKRRLEREVAEMETFIEAVPSALVITFFLSQIWLATP